MKTMLKLLLISLVAILTACSNSHTAKQSKMSATSGMFTSASELNWTSPFGKAPIQFATAYGDTFKAPHGTFGKFPGNFITPEHVHSHSYHGIVVSGTMTNPMKGDTGTAKKMSAGSYWHVPANAIHQTACISVEPCEFYMHQTTNFDFTPADAKTPINNAAQSSGIFTSASELDWTSPFGKAPIQFAVAFGNTFKSSHGTFGKFPSGFTTPEHTHSHSYHAIVISGTITNPMTGDSHQAKEMGPGSYWHVPANAAHKTACVSAEPCEFYMHQVTNFDFTPVK